MKQFQMKNLKYNNIKLILEYSEFNQYQMDVGAQNPLGPSFGFATDPSLSIYGSDEDSPYVDYYRRTSGTISRLNQITKAAMSNSNQIEFSQQDNFMDDIENFSNYKILRIFRNQSLHLDIFISFEFNEEEFFGVFKNFNWFSEAKLDSEMYGDVRFNYMNKEYRLKLSTYMKNILDNWFRPDKEFYINLKEDCPVKTELGGINHLKKGSTIEIKGVDMEKDGTPYIIMKQNNKKYYLKNNDYFFFNYWFEPLKK